MELLPYPNRVCSKITLSKRLVNYIGSSNPMQVYFTTGGALAVDNAIKISRAYTKKKKIISFDGGFHGYTLGAIMLNGEGYVKREQYMPMPGDIISMPFAYCFKCPFNLKSECCNLECTQKLEKYLSENNDVAAAIIEPIQGAQGFIIPPKKFIKKVDEILKKYNVVFIADEIQMALGRAGKMFSFQHFDVNPDIVLLSKSLAGGFWPLSVIIAKSEIFNAVGHKGSGIGSTFGNSILGTNIAMTVLDVIEKENLLDNSTNMGSYFLEKLKKYEKFSFIADLTGIGLAQSFCIVKDSGKNDFNPYPELAKVFQNLAFKEHVIIYIAGIEKNRVKFALPINVNSDTIDMIITKLDIIFDKLNDYYNTSRG